MQNTLKIALSLAVVLVGFCAEAGAACTDTVVRSGSKEPVLVALEPNTRPVQWSPSVEAAQRVASEKQRPFLIYFCSDDLLPVAGGDALAFEHYRKSHSGDSPDWTVFDCPRMTAEMFKIGIASFVKVADTPENAKLLAHYGAHAGMMVMCTPEGDKFAECNGSRDEVLETLFTLHDRYEEWLDGNTANSVANNDRYSRFR